MSSKTVPREPRRVVVTGIGLVSPLADDPAVLHQALVEGKSGLVPISLFETEALGRRHAGEVADFDPTNYLGRVNLRPIDRTARLVIVAAHLAFEASGWTSDMRSEHEVGLVLGTMFGSVHTIAAFDRRGLVAGPKYVKPFEFANSVINAAAGQTAIWHDLRGINSTVAGGTAAGLQALGYAAEMIRTGRADAILAGGADELCFESLYGFHQGGRLCGEGDDGPVGCVPFGAGRSGFALGEGAGLLMLEEASAAEARGAQVLAEIRGHGNCYDCSRGNDERSAIAVQRAIRLALADAGLAAGDVAAVSAAASGSVLGDRHEALGLAATFENGIPPITAVKSMLGECLGASGAYATIALVESMHAGVLPGVRGLDELDDSLPLDGVGAESREISGDVGLVNAVGLDGNVAAVVVEAVRSSRAEAS